MFIVTKFVCFLSDTEKVQIQKVFTHYGFKYYLDAPTSSSVRRDDDKVSFDLALFLTPAVLWTLEFLSTPAVVYLDYPISPTYMSPKKSQSKELSREEFTSGQEHYMS